MLCSEFSSSSVWGNYFSARVFLFTHAQGCIEVESNSRLNRKVFLAAVAPVFPPAVFDFNFEF